MEEQSRPRWKAQETQDTAFELANLIDENWQELDTLFENGKDVTKGLRSLGHSLQKQIAKVGAGSSVPTEEEVQLAMTLGSNAITGFREGVRRKFLPSNEESSAIRKAFGVGQRYKKDDPGSVLEMLSQALAAYEAHPTAKEALKIRPDRLAKLKEVTQVLSKAEESNPRSDARKSDPLVAERNKIQLQIEQQVDDILSVVAVNCWDKPELLVTLKDALPSRPYRKTDDPEESNDQKEEESTSTTPQDS